MARAKKTATKKKAPAKKPVAKKAPVKKAAPKKAPVKRTTTKKAAPKKSYESFQLSNEKTPFFTYKVTDQTIYWLVLSVVVFILALWVLHLHLEVVRISAGLGTVTFL